MKRLFIYPTFLFTIAISATHAQRSKQTIKKMVIDHFFTCSMDKMFDSIAIKCKLPIFFEREGMKQYDSLKLK